MFESVFSKQGLSLDRLRNFLLVAEKGSIAEAVNREPSRQSLVSRQIRELEAFFEVELTRRVGKTIELTEQGQELARVTRRCFSGLEDYILRQSGGRPLLRVGAGFSTMQWIITPQSVELANILDSELEMVRMRSRDARELLRTGEIDLAVVRSDAVNAKDEQLFVFPIGECGYALFGAKDSNLPLAVLTGGGQFEQMISEAVGNDYPTRIHCSSLLQTASLVAAEQACSILPEIAKTMFKRMDWIEQRPFPSISHYRREWVVAASRRQMETRGMRERQIQECAKMLTIRL